MQCGGGLAYVRARASGPMDCDGGANLGEIGEKYKGTSHVSVCRRVGAISFGDKESKKHKTIFQHCFFFLQRVSPNEIGVAHRHTDTA